MKRKNQESLKDKLSLKKFKIGNIIYWKFLVNNKKEFSIIAQYTSRASKFYHENYDNLFENKFEHFLENPENVVLIIDKDYVETENLDEAPHDYEYEKYINDLLRKYKEKKNQKLKKIKNNKDLRNFINTENSKIIKKLSYENYSCNEITKNLNIDYQKVRKIIKKENNQNNSIIQNNNLIILKNKKKEIETKFCEKLQSFIENNNNRFLTVKKIRHEFIESNQGNYNYSLSTFYRKISQKNKLNYRRKKMPNKLLYYSNDELKKQERYEKARLLLYYMIEGYEIIYLDETGININIKPDYGLYKRGSKINISNINRDENNFSDNITLLAAITNKKVLGFQFFDGSCVGNDFYAFLTNIVKKYDLINTKYIFLMDNSRTHNNRLKKKALAYFNFYFIPSFSPMINSIEYFFFYFKKELKKNFYTSKKQLINESIDILLYSFEEKIFEICFKSTLKYLKSFVMKEDIFLNNK